jgi:transposase
MRFYNRQHRHYCGIDLHVKTMYVCVLDAGGQVLVHRNVNATPEAFLTTVAPYRDDLVVAAECMFTWYWLADVCAAEGIAFVLGHALAMKAIHGGKAKNDKIDSLKIVTRFDRVQEFASYARLVKCAHISAGKVHGRGGAKMGNVHLKWAFSEAAVLYLRHAPGGKRLLGDIEKKHGTGKALSILAHKIGRAVFYMLSRGTVFSTDQFRAA